MSSPPTNPNLSKDEPRYVVRILCAGILWLGMSATAVCQQAQYQSQPASPAVSVVDRSAEFKVKAVYLYNFARSMEWPEHPKLPSDVFRIGVLGNSPVSGYLKSIAAKRQVTNKRTQKQQRMDTQEFTSLDQVSDCHMLFISESFPDTEIEELLVRFRKMPVLLVGETDGFASGQGEAELLLINGGVRFNLNLPAMKVKQLKIDAKLLKAANHIYDGSVVNSVSQN